MTTVILDETFTNPDLSKWTLTGYDWAPGQPNAGNGTESQAYDPSALSVSNGQLVIAATKTPRTVNGVTYPYTSGMVTTSRHVYGRPADQASGKLAVTVRAALPMSPGMWPAIWLLPQDYSWPPEIDVMEAWGGNPTPQKVTHNLHYASGGVDLQAPGSTVLDPTVMHDYGIVWTKTSLQYLIDGQQVGLITGGAVPQVPMYLLINLAVQGAKVTSATVFPARMLVDRVTITS
jgi:beta-glucanase (GH16 family)